MTLLTKIGKLTLVFKGIKISVFLDENGRRQFFTKQQLAEILIP